MENVDEDFKDNVEEVFEDSFSEMFVHGGKRCPNCSKELEQDRKLKMSLMSHIVRRKFYVCNITFTSNRIIICTNLYTQYSTFVVKLQYFKQLEA